MKTKVVLSVVILFSVMAFIFKKPTEKENTKKFLNPTSGVNDTVFTIGACSDGNDPNYSRLTDSLKFNLWFRYLGIDITPDYYLCPKGWTSEDLLLNMDSTPYLPNVRSLLGSNQQANMNTLMERPKTEWLVFGQRSDYQCEDVLQNADLWFYRYNEHPRGRDTVDNTSFGNGLKARVCKFGIDDSGYVAKKLIANREQINVLSRYGVPYPGFGDKQFDWYVKPRIRIDSMSAYNDVPVCRIEVYNFDDSLIRNVTITGLNFIKNNQYNGIYLDEYEGLMNIYNLIIPGNRDTSQKNAFNSTWRSQNDENCKVDFRVYWLGECDMWIDYVRVEDERAHRLLSGTDKEYNQMLRLESKLAYDFPGTAFRFYSEEFQFNHLPCLKYVYDYIKQNSGVGASFYGGLGEGWYSDHVPGGASLGLEHYRKYFIDSVKPKELIYGAYPFIDWTMVPSTKIPNSLPVDSGAGIYATPVSPQSYDNWLQRYMEDNGDWSYGDFIRQLKNIQNLCKTSNYNLNFFSPIQTHLHRGPDGHQREPTNEELEMMVNTSVSYGSKGIIYFWYDAWGTIPEHPDTGCSRGLVNLPSWIGIYPRYINEYGQLKWQKVKDIDKKLKIWGPKLMSFPISNTNSYIFRNQTERTALNSNSYFIYFATLKPGDGTPDCGNQEYTPDNIPQGFTYDCLDSTYLQIATFKNTEPNTEYFMVVNRRCSPVNENDSLGGKRKVRAVLHSDYSAFPDSANMSIYDCEKDSVVAVFKTHNPYYVDLGWFMPGEGKLFKIVPITETGGTLVGDEYVNSSVTIKKNIYNNGYNITFGPSANVSFEDSAGIYMNGGVLKIGNESQSYGTNLQIRGASSNKKWQGLVLEECDTVLIYGATFSNILSGQPAINMTNCYNFKVMNSLFNCGSNENSGGVYADYNESPEGDGDSIYQYIGYNVFSFNESSNNVIQVVSTASPEIPLIIEGNQFNTGAGSVSSSGIFLSNITGGAIKHNEITNYINGIILFSSSCDFFENLISSNQENTKAIQLKIGEGEAGPSNGYFTGGYNEISTLGSGSMNIDVTNSYFNIDEGYNMFDIDFSNSLRHISGYFPSSSESEYKAGYNCFKNNSTEDTASIFVTQGYEGDRITFNTSPTYCSSNELQDYQVFMLPGGINDTVYIDSEGEGGGYKDGQAMAIETQTGYKVLKDSININIRKRNYSPAELECKEMLLLYPDSSVSISAISKLYLSSLSLDSAGNHIQTTKTFYENLILNNPNNTPLIKRANYFVQKCKVTLKQYASALQGFQEIINQNPYSYEGLIASWDYAATTLLMGSGGLSNVQLSRQGGSSTMDNVQLEEQEKNDSRYSSDVLQMILDSLRNKKTVINSYTTENYDTKKFTKQDREAINTNVTNAFKDEHSKQVGKLKELEKKITTLSNSTSTSKSEAKINDNEITEAKKELKTMKTLGEIVKVRKPKDLKEHVKIVNADIKKVFGTDIVKGNSKTNILIPVEFSLSQNYPNPFNPVTKINYELPKDGKVKLVIYDILGREIKTLVNEINQAGRYTIEFNGNNYASGVYFYRIQIEGGKSFTAVKKMVLIK